MNEPAATPAASPGGRLKAEREQRGISAEKAAIQLHLDPWVVEAIEADDYPKLGPTVFAKGHLKRYATLLGLPPAEILAGFEGRDLNNPVMPEKKVLPALVFGSRAEGAWLHDLSPVQMLGGALVILAAVVLLWWKPWRQREPHDPNLVALDRVQSAPPAELAPAGASAVEPAAGPQPSTVQAKAAPLQRTSPLAERASPALAVPSATSTTAAGAGRARLRLSFSADSWVEITDANGKRLFVGTGQANSVQSVAGLGPLHVFLKSASGVQLEMNDHVVAIGAQYFGKRDAARFQAGADGVLRPESASMPPPRCAPCPRVVEG